MTNELLSTRQPRLILILSLLLIAVMLPGLGRLTINTDGAALVPADAPEVQQDKQLRGEFGLNDQAVALVDGGSPGSIYTVDNLRLIQRLSTRIQEIPQIGPLNVASLATELSDRFIPGALTYYTLLEPFPGSDEACQRVQDDVEANGLYIGTLVAADGSAAAILIGTPAGIDRIGLSRAVWAIIADIDCGNARVNAIGAPFAEALLGNTSLRTSVYPRQYSVTLRPVTPLRRRRPASSRYALGLARTSACCPSPF